MSLVHDALEKAKREASAKSARELGLPEARVGQPFRARRRLHPAAVAALAVAVTLAAVAGIAFWPKANSGSSAASSSPEPQATAPPAATLASPPTPAAPLASSADDNAASAPATPPATTVAAAPEPTSSAPAPQPSQSPGFEPAPVPVGEPAAAPVTAPVAAIAAPARRPAGETVPSFVRQLTLNDGTVVRLGGIAWSEEAPLAYLNGKLYAKGESVAGLTIAAIERDRVLLVGSSGRLALKLR